MRLAVDITGSGAPVILLHGGGQTRHSWRGTADALAARGYCAYSVDLRGHGDSEWPDSGDYSLEAFKQDILVLCHQLKTPPVLIGASLGGAASLAAIGETHEPIAAALVMVDVAPRIEATGVDRITSFMRARHDFASLEEAAEAVSAYNPARPRPKDLEGLKKNLRQRADGRWAWHWDPRFMRAASDETRVSIDPERLEKAARALTLPVLLVRGRQSDLLSEDGAKQFMALVPHARFVDVAGAGHMIAGDRNDIFNSAILDFLRGRPESHLSGA